MRRWLAITTTEWRRSDVRFEDLSGTVGEKGNGGGGLEAHERERERD
jgi:hypothetical protein